MSKITLEKGPWGDYDAYIDGVKVENKGVKLDRAELLEQVLAKIGIEVETKWHYYTTKEVEGKLRGHRVEGVSSNMKKGK
jgi:ribosomal protein L12E/L44/L45/RPP1/RPP2